MPGIRRQARMIALQTLYEYDTASHNPTEVLQRHTEERHLHPKVGEYASELVLGVCDHLAEIDAHIQSAAREWPLQQMARIDKNILRLAIYEILFNNTVPAKAAINEAVELAKTFGMIPPAALSMASWVLYLIGHNSPSLKRKAR